VPDLPHASRGLDEATAAGSVAAACRGPGFRPLTYAGVAAGTSAAKRPIPSSISAGETKL
jgi:hypothetical protein